MSSTNWDKWIADLSEIREVMLTNPIRGIAAVEGRIEGLWQEIRKNQDAPSQLQGQRIREFLKDISRLSIHGADLVDGWRLVLESASGEYGPGGTPESELFKSSRMSRLG
jgi:hypothetical protein